MQCALALPGRVVAFDTGGTQCRAGIGAGQCLGQARRGDKSARRRSNGHTDCRVQRSRGLLAKGCPLDLDQRVFAPGQCAQTRIAKTGALIWQIDDKPTFDIVVRRSFASYLWRWLDDASQEYRLG